MVKKKNKCKEKQEFRKNLSNSMSLYFNEDDGNQNVSILL